VLLQCLAGRLKRTLPGCGVVNEWPYTYCVDDEDGVVSVKGVMDHVVRYYDATVLTVEDKKLGLKLDDGPLGQTKSQISFAADTLLKGYGVRPNDLWGVLQNGPLWCFIRRRMTPSGRVQWNHAFAPVLFDTEVLEENVKIVAQCLEFICQNAEAIGNEMNRPGRLQSVAERSQSADSGSDDNERAEEDFRGNTQEVPQTPPPRTGVGGSTHDRRGGTGRGRGHHEKKHASGHAVGGKENCTVFYNVLPLTYANVNRLPSMCKYV